MTDHDHPETFGGDRARRAADRDADQWPDTVSVAESVPDDPQDRYADLLDLARTLDGVPLVAAVSVDDGPDGPFAEVVLEPGVDSWRGPPAAIVNSAGFGVCPVQTQGRPGNVNAKVVIPE